MIAALEEDISNMESQLSRSKGYLIAANEEHHSLMGATGSVSAHTTLSEKMKAIQPTAESVSRKFTSTKGLYKWIPVNLTENKLSFRFVGASPESSIELSFRPSGVGPVSCKAVVDPQIFRAHSSIVSSRFRTVSAYLRSRASAMCDKLSSQSVASPHRIGDILRQFELQHGRLEHTASELAMLHRRYNAILAPSQIPGSSNFQVEVDFSSSSSSAKLSAAFELTESYPFTPLDVRLDTFEGKVDVEGLRRLLIKNSKPGFGYLSRTCDVITAFLR